MKPYARKDSPYFYIKFMYKGSRRYVNTWQTDFNKAVRCSDKIMREWIRNHETCGDLTFDQLIDFDQKRYMTNRTSDGHFETSCGLHWRRLQEFFKDPSKITHDDLEDYIVFRKKQKRPDGSPAWALKTIREHLHTLKRGLTIAKENKGFDGLCVPKNWPVITQRGHVKGKRYASNDFSTVQMIKMVSYLQGHAKDEAMILLATGMRAHEAESCRWHNFTPRNDLAGCAGMLTIPAGEEDQERSVAIVLALLPILQRALPLTVDHKKVYGSAIERVTGNRKFGRRDFRASFISAHALGDTFGAHAVAGHKGAVMERYHNMPDSRKAELAVATWKIFFGDMVPTGLHLVPTLGTGLGSKLGTDRYLRRRLAVENSK